MGQVTALLSYSDSEGRAKNGSYFPNCAPFCRLGHAVVNPYPKFELSNFTVYEDTKDNAKCIKSGNLGWSLVRGHSRSLAMSPLDTDFVLSVHH